MSKHIWLVLSFISAFLFTSQLTVSITRAEPPQEPRRDVFLEALNKSRHGLSDTELKGKQNYNHYCSICHGEKGLGDGFNSYNLNPRPKSFAEIGPPMDDQHLYKVISEGTSSVGKTALCPPRGLYLEPDTINAIVAYLRKLIDNNKENE